MRSQICAKFFVEFFINPPLKEFNVQFVKQTYRWLKFRWSLLLLNGYYKADELKSLNSIWIWHKNKKNHLKMPFICSTMASFGLVSRLKWYNLKCLFTFFNEILFCWDLYWFNRVLWNLCVCFVAFYFIYRLRLIQIPIKVREILCFVRAFCCFWLLCVCFFSITT